MRVYKSVAANSNAGLVFRGSVIRAANHEHGSTLMAVIGGGPDDRRTAKKKRSEGAAVYH